MFSVRKPRGFRRSYIYYDERKAKREEIEEQAKRDLGLLPPKQFKPEDIRGKFVEATTHLKRRKQKGKKPMSPWLIGLIIIGLIALMHFLTL